jgi:hypothetical protein
MYLRCRRITPCLHGLGEPLLLVPRAAKDGCQIRSQRCGILEPAAPPGKLQKECVCDKVLARFRLDPHMAQLQEEVCEIKGSRALSQAPLRGYLRRDALRVRPAG